MSKNHKLFLLGAAGLLFLLESVARFCHNGILWAEETLPLAAALQMHAGKVLYRDVWFDKPPLVPLLSWALGAAAGWPLRLLGAFYVLLACWVAYRFARDLWGEREGLWAAGLLGFFLTFDLPAAVIPLAADLLMLAPHLAAVWLAYRRRPLWSGALAGIAFLANPKGVLVLAACLVWYPAGWAMIVAGFAAVSGVAAVWLWSAGALSACWNEVWWWGRLYAGSTFVEAPLQNGVLRTLGWLGFHSAAVLMAIQRKPDGWRRWLLWLGISLIGVVAGLRFFPRYYFQILPIVLLLAARGFTLAGRKTRILAALLLLVPATRFGPPYVTALRNHEWRDTAMDRDSRAAAALVRKLAKPGDTILVWGYRPEIYVYAGLPAATMFLDSQALTGVPADRHLTQSTPVETEQTGARRAELARSHPSFVLDGLGTYNPQLAIGNYRDLQKWFASYQEAGRTAQTTIYNKKD